MEAVVLASSLSLRSYTRSGSGLSFHGTADCGMSFSVLDFVSMTCGWSNPNMGPYVLVFSTSLAISSAVSILTTDPKP